MKNMRWYLQKLQQSIMYLVLAYLMVTNQIPILRVSTCLWLKKVCILNDFNVAYSSRWGYSLINTHKLKKS